MGMEIMAQTCERCEGTGHDKGGMPRVEMVPFSKKEGHRKYTTSEHEQRRYHSTIKQGSGCIACGGVGYVELRVS